MKKKTNTNTCHRPQLSVSNCSAGTTTLQWPTDSLHLQYQPVRQVFHRLLFNFGLAQFIAYSFFFLFLVVLFIVFYYPIPHEIFYPLILHVVNFPDNQPSFITHAMKAKGGCLTSQTPVQHMHALRYVPSLSKTVCNRNTYLHVRRLPATRQHLEK